MKTKIFQIAMAAMLLMAGCAKDELLNDNSVENNLLKKGRITTTNFTFFGNPNMLGGLYENPCWVSQDVEPHPEWKLLRYGNFSGQITGFGKIVTDKSTYEIVGCTAVLADPPEAFEYKYIYELIIRGSIEIGKQSDKCDIVISLFIAPFKYVSPSGQIMAGIKGTATLSGGTGKLAGLNGKTLNVFSSDSQSNDLSIGALYLKITTFMM